MNHFKIPQILKYIILTVLGVVLFLLCRSSGQARGGGEWLLTGLPVFWWVLAKVWWPIVADVREMLEGGLDDC